MRQFKLMLAAGLLLGAAALAETKKECMEGCDDDGDCAKMCAKKAKGNQAMVGQCKKVCEEAIKECQKECK